MFAGRNGNLFVPRVTFIGVWIPDTRISSNSIPSSNPCNPPSGSFATEPSQAADNSTCNGDSKTFEKQFITIWILDYYSGLSGPRLIAEERFTEKTMDVLLLAATGGLMACLPRRILSPVVPASQPSSPHRSINNNNHNINRPLPGSGLLVFTISLGLSLTLFSLSVVELLPGSCLMWFSTTAETDQQDIDDLSAKTKSDERRGGWTISDAYRVVLWAMAIVCAVIIPSVIGTQVLLLAKTSAEDAINSREEKPSDHDDKMRKGKFSSILTRHWFLRWLYRIVCAVVSSVFRAMHYTLAPLWRWVRTSGSGLCEKIQLPVLQSDRGALEKRGFRVLLSSSSSVFQRFWYDPMFRRCVFLGSVGGTSFFCSLLLLVSPSVIEPSRTTMIHDLIESRHLFLLRVVSWLCSVGILLSTVLNGFGSISLPYSCLAGLFLEQIPRDAIVNAEVALERARTSLSEKINDVNSGGMINVPLGHSQPTPVSSGSSSTLNRFIWKKVSRNFSGMGDEVSRRKQVLRTEIEFLETLIDEMSADIEEMRASDTVSSEARSSSGRIRSWIGVFGSVFLLVRLAWAMSSVWSQYTFGLIAYRASRVDPVTRIMLWLTGNHIVRDKDFHTLAQFVSLAITACLSFSQMRTFLRICATVQRRFANFYRRCHCKPRCRASMVDYDDIPLDVSPFNKETTWYLSYMISLLMCCYCLACVVLTKMMLPDEYRSSFSSALHVSATENDMFTIRTFTIDATFSVTAIFTGVILAMTLGIMRSNARRYGSIDNDVSVKRQASSKMAEL